MTPDQTAIFARRHQTNQLIAARDAEGLKAYFDPKARVIAADGTLHDGADAILQTLARQFANPDFQRYLRTADKVEVAAGGLKAAEYGHATGTWRKGQGTVSMTGAYLACWRNQDGTWLIESELYVLLDAGR